ncbi:hypothetical protein NUM3379_41270 [Kineococcus sp. NUM-3379]
MDLEVGAGVQDGVGGELGDDEGGVVGDLPHAVRLGPGGGEASRQAHRLESRGAADVVLARRVV